MAQKAPDPIPVGMHTVTPVLFFNGNCKEAIEFYKKALHAKIVGEIYPSPDGKGIWHAMINIGDSNIMLSDAMPGSLEKGPKATTTVGIWLYVKNCDTLFKNAVKNGAEEVVPLNDAFWGDRFGKLKDPFGHSWTVATYKWIYTPKEMEEKQKEMMEQMA